MLFLYLCALIGCHCTKGSHNMC